METIRRTLFPSSYCPLLISAQISCCLPSCSFAWNTCSLRKGQSLHCVLWPGPLSYSGNLLQQFSLSCDTNSPSPLDVLIGIHAGCFNFHLKSPLDPTSLFQPMLHFSPCLQCTCAYSSTDALPPSFCHPSSTKTVLVKAINDLHVAESSNHLLISDLLINSIQNCWLLLDHITSLLRTCSWFSSSHNGHLVCLLCWPSLRPTLLTSLYLQHSSLYLLSVLSAFMCLGISCNLSHSP